MKRGWAKIFNIFNNFSMKKHNKTSKENSSSKERENLKK